jgi:hypothetical protein
MQFMNQDPSDKMFEKVRALLAKAESTTFSDEADALVAKAQELISKYSIDVSLMTPSGANSASPLTREIRLDDPYARAKFSLFTAVAQNNDCHALWTEYTKTATVFGLEHDIVSVELLYSSLLLQATTALLAAGSHTDAFGRSVTRSFRRTFLLAYAYRIGARLQAARTTAVDDAVVEHGTEVGLVLASKREAVTEAFQVQFPNVASMRQSASNAAGYAAGVRAADAAYLGVTKRIQAS